MAKVTFVPGSGTLAAYLSGEIDHHAAQDTAAGDRCSGR